MFLQNWMWHRIFDRTVTIIIPKVARRQMVPILDFVKVSSRRALDDLGMEDLA